ncbi:MAG: hypothetical protein FJY60_06525, partial [Betaproteobacteria bacterium]|nr:hypothetical protein [Betaproteobacteria bacterium]
EIYAARKDRQKFGTLAAELRVLTHGVGEAWAQAQMGMLLDPGNLSYGAAVRSTAEFAPASPKPVVAQPAETTSPVADFEFKLEGLLGERHNDITSPPVTAATGSHLASAKAITLEASSGDTASYATSDLANTLEFNLSDSITSAISVSASASSWSASSPLAVTQKSVGSGPRESDLASLKTKLDLAIACREIGDHEGARELFAEVAASPHPELSQRAQSLLSQLA